MRSNRTSIYTTGVLTALLGSLSYTIMAWFVQLAYKYLSISQILFCSSFGSAVIVGIQCRREIRNLWNGNAKSIWFRSLFGTISVFCYFLNLKLSGVGDATLLTDINPIFVAIFGNCYFGIKIEKQSWIGIGLCTVGIVLLAVLTHGIADNLMIPIGLTSAMFGALAYISLKEATKTHSPRLIIFSFLIVLSITGLMMMERIPTALSPELLLILGVIIVFNLLGQFLTTASFKYLDTHLASILTITACLWGYLIDILFFTKSISAALISPIGMLIGGTALVVFEKRSRIR